MTPEQFIQYLKRHCRDKIVGEPAFFERDNGRDDAYKDVIRIINIYMEDFYGKNTAA